MRKLEDWIEYMEGEGILRLMGKLGMLLRYSSADQLVLDNLRRLRRLLKGADPACDIEDQISSSEFLGNFHAATMELILSSREVKTSRELKTSKRGRVYARVQAGWAEFRHRD